MVKKCYRETLGSNVTELFSWTEVERKYCTLKYRMKDLKYAKLITRKKDKLLYILICIKEYTSICLVYSYKRIKK